MAERDSTLKQDIADVIRLSYPIEAMLHGALSLLEGYIGDDRNGDVFHAQQLIELAEQKAKEIYVTSDQLKIEKRAGELEAAGGRHD